VVAFSAAPQSRLNCQCANRRHHIEDITMNIRPCAAPVCAPLLPLLLLLLSGYASAAQTTEPASIALQAGAAHSDSVLHCTLPSNCVNSLGDGAMAPLHFSGTTAQGVMLLQSVLRTFPEATVVQANDTLLETIFTTPIGFKDRVTFIVDAPAGRIHFRSGSRFGLYDFGKNRSRMTEFTSRFERAATQ
jgi:uncharacterized protein (DUF1499 family)